MEIKLSTERIFQLIAVEGNSQRLRWDGGPTRREGLMAMVTAVARFSSDVGTEESRSKYAKFTFKSQTHLQGIQFFCPKGHPLNRDIRCACKNVALTQAWANSFQVGGMKQVLKTTTATTVARQGG
jgi:hypothetical protein